MYLLRFSAPYLDVTTGLTISEYYDILSEFDNMVLSFKFT